MSKEGAIVCISCLGKADALAAATFTNVVGEFVARVVTPAGRGLDDPQKAALAATAIAESVADTYYDLVDQASQCPSCPQNVHDLLKLIPDTTL